MTARALLVYAVCRRPPGRFALAGIAGERLGVVEAGRLAAITGELARPPKASLSALRRYDRVLRELAGRLPAVLPARFGTCMASVEELAFVLRSREASLRAALRDVRGRVQVTLRGVAPPAAGAAQAQAHAPAGGPGA
ncbi:GvpL/GvpF family gas vesicle protein, partial [Ramlibacter monticola]